MIGLEEGLLPHARSLGDDDEMEEEASALLRGDDPGAGAAVHGSGLQAQDDGGQRPHPALALSPGHPAAAHRAHRDRSTDPRAGAHPDSRRCRGRHDAGAAAGRRPRAATRSSARASCSTAPPSADDFTVTVAFRDSDVGVKRLLYSHGKAWRRYSKPRGLLRRERMHAGGGCAVPVLLTWNDYWGYCDPSGCRRLQLAVNAMKRQR